jgi:AmmeMemoRadiSam system protein A
MLNNDEKRVLISFARNSIQGEDIDTEDIADELIKPSGVFVTLTKDNRLRGCIGYVKPVTPLYKAVIKCAYEAAYCDIRFPPVQKEEIASLNIEISVLSEPKPLVYNSPDDLLQKLNPNLGLVIQSGFHKATFLPQVWEELPDKKDFLGNLCLKAGLNSDFWQYGNLEVLTYTADKFSEREQNQLSY